MNAPTLISRGNDEPFNIKVDCNFQALREALTKTHFAENREVLSRMPAIVREHRIHTSSPANTLLRLFWYGDEVSRDALTEALGGLLVEQLTQIGIIRPSNYGYHSKVALTFSNGGFFFVDLPRENHGLSHVMDVSGSSLRLAELTPRKRVRSVLDVGTGSGFQAILAAAHADNVTATDISSRALNFAALNAGLNAVGNIAFRQGNLFEPVKEDMFDLILTNPPFVVSPQIVWSYRDSGLRGDAISEQVVRGAAQHLNEGGYAVIQVSWYYDKEENWAQHPTEWLDALDCDGWCIRYDKYDPLDYVGLWVALGESVRSGAVMRMVDPWLDYYKQLGATGFSCGAIILRKCASGPKWQRFEDFSDAPLTARFPTGSQLEHIFRVEDFLNNGIPEREVLDQTLCLNPRHSIAIKGDFGPGMWTVNSSRLSSTEGFAFSADLNRFETSFLENLDGNRTVRDVIERVEQLFQEDANNLAEPLVAFSLKLLTDGLLLLPAHSSDTN